MVVIKEFRGSKCLALQLVLQLGEHFFQHILVVKLGMEEESTGLDIRNTRLPIDIEQVDTLNGDITQAIQLALIPYDLVNTGAGFHLLPHCIGIGGLKLVMFQDAGDNSCQFACLALIHGLSR